MEEIARVYADALFGVAKEKGKLDVIREQLGEFADAVAREHDLQVFFFSPYFSTEEKEDGLHKAVTDAHESVVNFLSVLLENHRMPVIFRVRREYDRLWEDANKLLPVQITSAVELDPSVAQRVGDEIGRQTGRTVELTSTVDPEVLGGIAVRVGNSIIDATIRTRLENLRKQVVKA